MEKDCMDSRIVRLDFLWRRVNENEWSFVARKGNQRFLPGLLCFVLGSLDWTSGWRDGTKWNRSSSFPFQRYWNSRLSFSRYKNNVSLPSVKARCSSDHGPQPILLDMAEKKKASMRGSYEPEVSNAVDGHGLVFMLLCMLPIILLTDKELP